MILVDTSVWAAFFNGDASPEATVLDRILTSRDEEIVSLPVIVTEVLQGFRAERSFERAEKLLKALTILEPSLETHVEAARLFRRLRRKGITVRGTVDCLIAQTCIETSARLLTMDRDFWRIAEQTTLILVDPAE